jgi:hypothetical protein
MPARTFRPNITGPRQTRSASLDSPPREDPEGADFLVTPTRAPRLRSSPSHFSSDLNGAVLGVIRLIASESVVWADLWESRADQLEAARHAVLRISTPISGGRPAHVEILYPTWGGEPAGSWWEEYAFTASKEDASEETASLVHLATTGIAGVREVKATFEDED